MTKEKNETTHHAQITNFALGIDKQKREFVNVTFVVGMMKEDFDKLVQQSKMWGVEIEFRNRD